MKKIDLELESFRSPLGNKLPILGQMVIVTTVDADGGVNAAVKSDIMNMVSDPPILAFGCNLAHHTAQNILETHEFVVNIAGEDIIAQAMETAKEYPPEVNELEKAGLTAVSSSVVTSPRIKECPIHLECIEEYTTTYDDEIIIFGRVVKVGIDEDVFNASIEDRYKKVKPVVTLGEFRYAAIDMCKKMIDEK